MTILYENHLVCIYNIGQWQLHRYRQYVLKMEFASTCGIAFGDNVLNRPLGKARVQLRETHQLHLRALRVAAAIHVAFPRRQVAHTVTIEDLLLLAEKEAEVQTHTGSRALQQVALESCIVFDALFVLMLVRWNYVNLCTGREKVEPSFHRMGLPFIYIFFRSASPGS